MSQPSRNRRQIRNLLLDPDKQYRQALIYFAFIASGAFALQMVQMRAAQRFVLETLTASGVDPSIMMGTVDGAMRSFFWRSGLLFPILAVFSLFFALRMTHQYLGPQVALKRHIAALRDGNYDSVCRLRSTDELQELCSELNGLAATLRERHGSAGQERDQAA